MPLFQFYNHVYVVVWVVITEFDLYLSILILVKVGIMFVILFVFFIMSVLSFILI